MSDDAMKARVKAYFESDFTIDPGVADQLRLNRAAEYSAYQLGQINRKLGEIVEVLKVIAKQ